MSKPSVINEPAFHEAIEMTLLRKKVETAEFKRMYWEKMAEEKTLDVEIKKKTLEDKEKSIELKNATISHLNHKDEILKKQNPSSK